MTSLIAAQPPPPGAIDALTRSHRDRSGAVRFYIADDLIGTLVQRRHKPPRGRASNRWFATPAAFAYTRGKIGATIPPAARAGFELDDIYVTRHAALIGLLTHLRVTGASAVAPLYAEPHAHA